MFKSVEAPQQKGFQFFKFSLAALCCVSLSLLVGCAEQPANTSAYYRNYPGSVFYNNGSYYTIPGNYLYDTPGFYYGQAIPSSNNGRSGSTHKRLEPLRLTPTHSNRALPPMGPVAEQQKSRSPALGPGKSADRSS